MLTKSAATAQYLALQCSRLFAYANQGLKDILSLPENNLDFSLYHAHAKGLGPIGKGIIPSSSVCAPATPLGGGIQCTVSLQHSKTLFQAHLRNSNSLKAVQFHVGLEVLGIRVHSFSNRLSRCRGITTSFIVQNNRSSFSHATTGSSRLLTQPKRVAPPVSMASISARVKGTLRKRSGSSLRSKNWPLGGSIGPSLEAGIEPSDLRRGPCCWAESRYAEKLL